MVNVRSKGQRGEREAISILHEWANEVGQALGLDDFSFVRNLDQSRLGGYDISSFPWLAIEVKRQETISLPAWWRQCERQATEGQVPFLMWKQNRRPWQFRVRTNVLHQGPLWASHSSLVLDLDHENAKLWFQTELYTRLRTDVSCDRIASGSNERTDT